MLNSIYLNRGTHGDSSFMLGGLPSSRENPPDLSVGSVKLCCSQFQLNANWMDLNYKTSRIENYYLIKKNGDTTGVRWNVLHGKKRKLFKFARKLVAKQVLNQYEIFNKYCGQEGILYIHARIGAGNWSYYGGPEIAKQPWFIEKVDDAFDCTYCDIYARISEIGNDEYVTMSSNNIYEG